MQCDNWVINDKGVGRMCRNKVHTRYDCRPCIVKNLRRRFEEFGDDVKLIVDEALDALTEEERL